MRRVHFGRAAVAGTVVATVAATALVGVSGGAQADSRYNTKTPTSVGYGGAVSSVDPEASRIGVEVLRRGGNAVDAAVATAAALGVTEPFSSGIGGGGYFVYYDASTGKVQTIDGRETAPAGMDHDAFIDPDTGEPYPFYPDRVTSGVSVGVPGTLATWKTALDEWGTTSLRQAFKPAIRLATRGFTVDETFRGQVLENKERFEAFTPTAKLYLPGGHAPEVGSVFTNKDLARTYRLLVRKGTDYFYDGPIAKEISQVVQHPPVSGKSDLPIPPGSMTPQDLADYEALVQDPTHADYKGYDLYGMAPSSSGGTTVSEIMNILEQSNLPADEVGKLHYYLEASALAFADRAKYVGDTAFVDVPVKELTSDGFAAERACSIDPDKAATKPVDAGEADGDYGSCATQESGGQADTSDTESQSTTNLTVVDRWGNVVEYTLTIEQIGGSGILVPHRGFLLNNELTDFSPVWQEDDPNRIEPGKRPRSSMSPTILLDNGKPFLALGSPGGSTIITTVAQMLYNRLDLGMTLPQAIAAPRASQRNTEDVVAEQAFIDAYGKALEAYGHSFVTPPYPNGEIGAATAIEVGKDGKLTAVSEPVRRGGGSALVVSPTPTG
jgi:gamma-glutamyltranspeptidase/glutathione hydrolase